MTDNGDQPPRSRPDRRTAVVTGANTGLGFEIARVLAAKGASVVLAVRNLDKGKDAAARISAETPGAPVALQRFDASSPASARRRRTTLADRRTTHRHARNRALTGLIGTLPAWAT